MDSKSGRVEWLASTAAIVGVSLWLAVVLALHLLKAGRYDPVGQAVSELALGDFGALMNVAFFALGIGAMALAVGLYRSVRSTVFGPLLLAVAGVLWFLSGIFQTGESGAGAAVHGAVGLASTLVIMVVMFLFARQFRSDARWRSFALPTFIWAVIAAGAFFLFPLLGDEAFGVAQRGFIAVWLSWLLAAAVRLRSVAGETSTAR